MPHSVLEVLKIILLMDCWGKRTLESPRVEVVQELIPALPESINRPMNLYSRLHITQPAQIDHVAMLLIFFVGFMSLLEFMQRVW